jgi:energy-converting hydrogenase Eha subunit A
MKLVCRAALCVTCIDDSNPEYWVFEASSLIPNPIFAYVLTLVNCHMVWEYGRANNAWANDVC